MSLSSSSSGSNYRRCYREIPPEPASPITMAAEPEEVLEVDGDAWMGTMQGQYDYDGPHPQPQRVRRAEPDERRDAPPHIRCDLCSKWVKNIGESLVQHQMSEGCRNRQLRLEDWERTKEEHFRNRRQGKAWPAAARVSLRSAPGDRRRRSSSPRRSKPFHGHGRSSGRHRDESRRRSRERSRMGGRRVEVQEVRARSPLPRHRVDRYLSPLPKSTQAASSSRQRMCHLTLNLNL